MSEKKQKLWNRYFISFMFIGFTISIPMQLYNAALVLYIDHLGGSASTMGIASIVFMVSAVLARMLGGNLADQVGRRVVMFISMLVFALATGFYALFPFIAAVFVLRALQAVGFGISNTAVSAAVADVIPPARIGEGIGYFGLCTSLSSAIGPAIGLALIAGGSFNNVFLFGAFMLLAGMVVLFFTNYEQISMKEQLKRYKESKAQQKAAAANTEQLSFKERYIEPKALPAAATQFVFGFAMSFSINYLTLFANQEGIANAGLFFTLSAIAMMAARLTVSRFADRVPGWYIMIPTAALGVLSFFLLANAPSSQLMFFGAGILYGFASGCICPLLNTEALRPVSSNRRGVASATYALSVDAGIGIGGFLWSLFIDSIGHIGAIYGCAVCVALTAVLYLFFFGRRAAR